MRYCVLNKQPKRISMIRSLLFLASFLFLPQLLVAQGNWLRFAGDNLGEETKSSIFDSGGNLVMTGFFNGSFNTGVSTLVSAGNTDIFIIKTSDTGNPIW